MIDSSQDNGTSGDAARSAGEIPAPDSTVSPSNSSASKVAVAICLGTAALTAFLLLRRPLNVINSPNREVVAHVVSSAVLTLALVVLLLVTTRRHPTVATAVLGGSLATIALEVAQLATSRAAQLDDAMAGFGGVLIVAALLDIARRRWTTNRTVAACTILLATGAALGALVLALNIGVSPSPLAQDGGWCPDTAAAGGERLVVGEPVVPNSCLVSEAGGLALIGADDALGLGPDTVFATSNLDDLFTGLQDDPHVILRVGFTTKSFETQNVLPGTIAMLASDSAGQLLHIQTRGARLDVLGPRITARFRSGSLSRVLTENTAHVIEIELSATALTTRVDGIEVASTAVESGWADELTINDLQLFIGNSRNYSYPTTGVIDWIEVDS